MQTPCSKGNDEAAHKKSGRTLCSRQSPVIVLQQRHPPELQDGVLLAAGGVVGGNVYHPALTPDEVIALPMDVQRFPHWLPCRRAHLPVGNEVQMMLPVHSLMVLKGFAVLCVCCASVTSFSTTSQLASRYTWSCLADF